MRRVVEERWNRRAEGGITGVPTGFGGFDSMTLGLQPGDLVIVAARPSMGKTAFALNIAANASAVAVPTLVFSLEMSTASLGERTVAAEGGIDSQLLRSGRFSQNVFIQLERAFSRLAERPLYIDESAYSFLDIRSRARRWRMNEAKDSDKALVVVDYLQLVEGRSSKEDSRQREISEISRGLKLLAKELRCPVVALSQLNRSLESRADKRPMMSDLRESGAIEQDADVIAFLYRDEVYDENSKDRGTAEVIIGKQRNGPTGTVRLAWKDHCSRFDNLSERGAA